MSAEILHGDKAISTHAPRTGSDLEIPDNSIIEVISTHAPRTGSDA